MTVSIITSFVAPDLLGRTARGAIVMSKHGIELVFEVADSIGYPKVSLSRAFVLTHEGVRRAPVENPELCRKMFSDCVWFGLTTKAVQEWEKLKGDPSPKG